MVTSVLLQLLFQVYIMSSPSWRSSILSLAKAESLPNKWNVGNENVFKFPVELPTRFHDSERQNLFAVVGYFSELLIHSFIIIKLWELLRSERMSQFSSAFKFWNTLSMWLMTVSSNMTTFLQPWMHSFTDITVRKIARAIRRATWSSKAPRRSRTKLNCLDQRKIPHKHHKVRTYSNGDKLFRKSEFGFSTFV